MFIGVPTYALRILDVTAHFGRAGTVSVVKNTPWANRGVAQSWNRLCEEAWRCGQDRIILANDDIEFSDLQPLWDAADDKGGPVSTLECGYACFCLPRRVWDVVGPFDINFWPAYLEDTDYGIRCAFAGLPDRRIPNATCQIVHRGPRTIDWHEGARRLVEERLPLLAIYYEAKWGGPPGLERYNYPFGRKPQ